MYGTQALATNAGGALRKLSSNESPYPPSHQVVAAIAEAARNGNRYPTLFGEEVAARLADDHGVGADAVTVGGGSLMLLQQILQALASPGDEIMFGWRSYEAYPILVQTSRCVPAKVPLKSYRLDLGAMSDRISSRTRVVVLCNPNNPTGTVLTSDMVEQFLGTVPSDCAVVLDEAYCEFGQSPNGIGDRLIRGGWENVLSLRTFSKAFRLAGLRIGYCVSSSEMISAVRRVALPFTVSRVAAAAALVCLQEGLDSKSAVIRGIVAERERLAASFVEMGVDVPPSQANFVWLPLGGRSEEFALACADAGVGVRCFDGEGVRLTIGLAPDNDTVVRVGEQLLDGWAGEG